MDPIGMLTNEQFVALVLNENTNLCLLPNNSVYKQEFLLELNHLQYKLKLKWLMQDLNALREEFRRLSPAVQFTFLRSITVQTHHN